MAAEDSYQVDSNEPVCTTEGVSRPFFPVTLRDRLICCLLLSVIVVACYNAVVSGGILLGKISEVSDSGSGGGLVADVVEEVEESLSASRSAGYDGAVVSYDEQTGGEVVELPEVLRELYTDDGSNAFEEPYGSGNQGSRDTLADWNGRDFYSLPGYSGQFREDEPGREENSAVDDGREIGTSRAVELIRSGYDRFGVENALELRPYWVDSSYCHSSGYYRLPADGDSLKHRAAWYGGVGVRAFSWLQTRIATSTVGKKLEKAGITAMLAMALGIGGYDVAVTEYNAIEAEQAALISEMEGTLANRAIMADAGEELYVLIERCAYNAENGISMSAAETVTAAVQDFETACTTGTLPTAANSTLESAIFDAITKGCYSVEALQPLAAAGEYLINLFNLENPSQAAQTAAFNDSGLSNPISANGNTHTITAADGTTFNFHFGRNSSVAVSSPSGRSGTDWDVLLKWDAKPGSGRQSYESFYWNLSNEPIILNLNYVNNSSWDLSGEMPSTWGLLYRNEAGQQVTQSNKHFSYPYNVDGQNYNVSVYIASDYVVKTLNDVVGGYSSQSGPYGPVSADQGVISGIIDTVLDRGTRIVGNDAEFGGNGELVSSGTVDYNNYVDNYNSGNINSWNDALAAADSLAVTPSNPSEGVFASDTVIAPGNPATGAPAAGNVGDNVRGDGNTPSRAGANVNFELDKIGALVADKFPFSVPYDVYALVDKLSSTREAPHFTWVFDVPTGQEEYEVDLSTFDSVAAVLRVMLDIVLVFGCISLLSKIAQLFNLVHD